MKKNLKGLTPENLGDWLHSLGEEKYRGKQIFHAIYRDRVDSLEKITTLPKKLKDRLLQESDLPVLEVLKEISSTDGTRKFSFRSHDGKIFESVWIPSGDEERKTICISSQSGCTLSCEFCATGRLKFSGNLSTWEILEQVLEVEKRTGEHCTNIVFMGMGEPMHNYENVIAAAHILHRKDAWNLGAKRITISTAGVVKGIQRFVDSGEPFNFAISLNHTGSVERAKIMGIEEKFPMDVLLSAARNFTKTLGRRITFEYIMIPEVNMGRENASRLVKILRSVNCKINLIPLNTDLNGWRRPTEAEMSEFIEALRPSGVPILNRYSPGKDIRGACGMLAGIS